VTLDDETRRIALTAAGGRVTVVIDGKASSVTVRADDHDVDLGGMISLTAANIQIQGLRPARRAGRGQV
jgi:hypothetical protein